MKITVWAGALSTELRAKSCAGQQGGESTLSRRKLSSSSSPPPALNPVFGPALVTQCWSCREGSEEPGGEEGEVKRLGGGRIFFLITSFGIMENCCMITPRFHSRVGPTRQELTEVETMGTIWDSAPAWGGYSMSVTKLCSSASMGYRHLIH